MRDSVFKTLNRIPPAREFLNNMDFRPVPVYKTGLFAKDSAGGHHPAAGALFIQPHVQTSTGEQVLFDEVLGPGFAVLSLGPAHEGVLSLRSRNFWASLPTRFVQILPAGATIDAAAAAPDTITVIDVTGRLYAWFEEHRGQMAMLRPDRYVFGVFPAHALREAEDKTRALHLGL
jgi:3-(3-hydroxy-phenyl)propionate hydroxylase